MKKLKTNKMASKSYKNVYTILEKVKKGEIKSYYKDDEGLFGKINFYRKPDLVKPYLHYIDESRLDSIVDHHMKDNKAVNEVFQRFAKTSDFKKVDPSKQPNGTDFYHKFYQNYKKFPTHMAKDIFKMFYNPIEKLDFEERNEKNHSKFKFLERANNPVGKIMSESSNLKSAIFAKNIMSYFVGRLTMLEYTDPQAAEQIKKSLGGGGSDFDNDTVDKAMSDMMDNKQGKDMLEKAMQDAQNLCKEIDGAMDEDVQQQMFDNANKSGEENTAGKLGPDYLKFITSQLESISLSMGSLKQKIKKLLDKSTSYFSANEKVQYEDLFNSDNMAGLEDYELLHPKLRKIFAEDLQVKSSKKVGKIDIYIDISGSMDSGCGVNNNKGNPISKLDFCKSFAAKLKSMDMLNDVYIFNDRVRKHKSDILSISMLTTSGGTNIDRAVQSIINNGVNALVITDAEDGCEIYSEKAFFIGIKGARFNYFDNATIQQYSQKDQVVVFEGDSVLKVDEKGFTIR